MVLQMDITNAFLYGDLEEILYMKLSLCYSHLEYKISKVEGEFMTNKTIGIMCRPKEFLYGLKQAPRNWFSKFSTTLVSIGFVQLKSDYSLFTITDEILLYWSFPMWMIC